MSVIGLQNNDKEIGYKIWPSSENSVSIVYFRPSLCMAKS